MELLNIKDKKQCIKCYAEIELDSNFCQFCGEEQPKSEVKEAEVIENEEIENNEEIEDNDTNNDR